MLKHEDEHDREGRVAFIAGKKLGNAVWRNRAKRRMRALCRDLYGPFEGYDVAFVARRTVNEASFCAMKDTVRPALLKMGITFGRDNA